MKPELFEEVICAAMKLVQGSDLSNVGAVYGQIKLFHVSNVTG